MHLVSIVFVFRLVTTEWEIPFEIRNHFFRVVGGYPTFIESYYPPVENITNDGTVPQLPRLWAGTSDRLLKWSCDMFPGDAGSCKSTLTVNVCRNDSQFSFSFWSNNANHTCEKDNQLVPCKNASRVDNVCQNAVVEIHNASSTVHFLLKDLKFSSVVTQLYTEGKNASTYVCHYTRSSITGSQPLQLLETGSKGRCERSSKLVKFGVNTTIECIVETKTLKDNNGCPSAEQMRELLVPHVSHICNCGSCGTPLLRQKPLAEDRNSTSCIIPHMATITFVHVNGFINGAQTSYGYRALSHRESNILLTTRTLFIEYKAPCQKTRFELQRGLFHCPSDVTCWRELWIPFEEVTQSTVSHIGCAVIVLGLSLLVMRHKAVSGSECDCKRARKVVSKL